MEVQERFVESVTNGRGRLEQDGNECNGADEAGQDQLTVGYRRIDG